MQLFTDNTTRKTYATPERCRAAAEAVEKETEHDFRWVMAVSGDGRFHPVFILSQSEMVYLHYFISKRFCIAG